MPSSALKKKKALITSSVEVVKVSTDGNGSLAEAFELIGCIGEICNGKIAPNEAPASSLAFESALAPPPNGEYGDSPVAFNQLVIIEALIDGLRLSNGVSPIDEVTSNGGNCSFLSWATKASLDRFAKFVSKRSTEEASNLLKTNKFLQLLLYLRNIT